MPHCVVLFSSHCSSHLRQVSLCSANPLGFVSRFTKKHPENGGWPHQTASKDARRTQQSSYPLCALSFSQWSKIMAQRVTIHGLLSRSLVLSLLKRQWRSNASFGLKMSPSNPTIILYYRNCSDMLNGVKKHQREPPFMVYCSVSCRCHGVATPVKDTNVQIFVHIQSRG